MDPRKLVMGGAALALWAAVLAGWPVVAAAQSSEGKLRPITIEKIEELAFGRLINSFNIPGETVIEAASGRKIVRGGMVDLSNTHARAEFLIRGEPKARVVINLPQELPLQGKGGATVVLEDFTSSPSGTGLLGPGGTLTVYVGATLKVKAGYPQGKFRADLDIFVDYQ